MQYSGGYARDLVGISSPPSGTAGVVGCCESHKMLGLKGAGVSTAETEVKGSLLVFHFAFHLDEVAEAVQHIHDLFRFILTLVAEVVAWIPGVSRGGHDEEQSEEHAAR